MAKCSIPNSTPATGRISTTSSRRSKNISNERRIFSPTLGLTHSVELKPLSLFNAQRSTLNAQRPIERVGRWMLDIERWAFSVFRRVKGAWWPSRSSKPSSPRKRRGRFDSYPLRHFKFDGRCLRFDFNFAGHAFKSNIKLQTSNICEGGDRLCRANEFANLLRSHPVPGEHPS
jgi:hypothetical protein